MSANKLLLLLNQGSREDLMKLTGIGEVLADSLIESRPFDSLTEAQHVNGISANLIQQLEQQVVQSELWPDIKAEIEAENKEMGEGAESEELRTETDQDVEEEISVRHEDVGEDEFNIQAKAMEAEEVAGETASEPILAASQPAAEIHQEEAAEVKDKGEEPEEADQDMDVKEGAAEHPQHVKPERISTKGVSVIALLASNMLTALVAIFLTLIVLLGINGSLRFATNADFRNLHRESSQLSTHVETLQQEIAGLRSRVDTLEGLGERLVVMESTQEQFSTDLEVTNHLVSDLQADLSVLNEQVEQQSERTQLFENFLMDLQMLLSSLFAPEGE